MSLQNNLFNLPHYKFDCDNIIPISEENSYKSESIILGERRFNLNKSKCKFVSVGLAYDLGYEPCIKLSGNKSNQVVFNENEWNNFLTYQAIIMNYLYSNDKTETINAGTFSIQFEQFSNIRVVKILKDNCYIFLGYETVCNLWELLPLVKYTVNTLKNQQFANYFGILQKGLQKQNGNVIMNALNILRPQENPNSSNISMVMEFIHIYPEIFQQECCGRV